MDEKESDGTLPSWLDIPFLTTALSREGSAVTVNSYKVEDISEPTSCKNRIYKVTAETKQGSRKEQLNLIIKSASEKDSKDETPLVREIKAYTSAISHMNTLLKTCQPISPQYYYSQTGSPVSALVLGDLTSQGFKTTMQVPGLNMEHCLLVMRKLAQFHASSAVLHAKHPDELNCYKTRTPIWESRTFANAIPNVLENLVKETKSWSGYKERLVDKLKDLADTAFDRLRESVKTVDSDFKVLCLLQLRPDNIMFRYSGLLGDVEDARFLDFKHVKWGSPALDIHMFLHSCAAPEVLEWSQVLMEEYYSALEDTLKRLKFSSLCPTIARYYDQVRKSVMFGLILGLVSRARSLADPLESEDLNASDSFHLSDKFKTVVKDILLVFQVKGWI